MNALLGNYEKALSYFGSNIALVLENFGKTRPFQFYLSGQLLFKKLELNNQKEVQLDLPQNLSFYQPNQIYSVSQISSWINQMIDQLVQQFNTRNGNTYFTDLVTRNEDLLNWE